MPTSAPSLLGFLRSADPSLQPVVLAEGWIWLPSSGQRTDDGTAFISAVAIPIPLRRFCRLSAPVALERHANRPAMAAAFAARRSAAGCTTVDAALNEFYPAMEGAWRAWNSGDLEAQDTADTATPSSEESPSANSPELMAACFAAWPAPALLVAGRFWMLVPVPQQPVGADHLRFGSQHFALSGEYIPVSQIMEEWRQSIDCELERIGRQLAERAKLDSTRLAKKEQLLTQQPLHVAASELALLQLTGQPLTLVHFIREHRNHTLGRTVAVGELAVGMSYNEARAFGTAGAPVQIFARGRSGQFTVMVRSVCPDKHRRFQISPQSTMPPILRAAVWLRWVANQIAEQGIFHEHDHRHD